MAGTLAAMGRNRGVEEACEGFLNVVNACFVTGWAWDPRRPDTPIPVEIWDGNTVIATVLADRFRADLRDAGKGDGRHGFSVFLGAHIRGRRRHAIDVRVAGTQRILPEWATGQAPCPITGRDRPARQLLPYFSLPPHAPWFYFTLLPMILRAAPQPPIALPAALLGLIRALHDPASWRLSAALSEALGQSRTRRSRLRTYWRRCYVGQCDLLLRTNASRITRRWAARHVRIDGTLPVGGAVLIAPHHALCHLGALRLASVVDRLGGITNTPRDPADHPDIDWVMHPLWQRTHVLEEEALCSRIYHASVAAREGLRLLREGGYLMMIADSPIDDDNGDPYRPFLGRASRLPRGAAWFAERSGKPIIPWMIAPEGREWRLWLGDPVPPTQDGAIAALEAGIRQSPASWHKVVAMPWMSLDVWHCEEPVARRG